MKLFSTLYFSVALVFVLLVNVSQSCPNERKPSVKKAPETSDTLTQENEVASAGEYGDSLLSAVRDRNFEKFMYGLDNGMEITEEVMEALNWSSSHRAVMSQDIDKFEDYHFWEAEDACDVFQMTPLHYAAYYNRADAIIKLKQVNGRWYAIFPKNSENFSPLYYAITRGSWDAAKVLIEMGPSEDEDEDELSITLNTASALPEIRNEFVEAMTERKLAPKDSKVSKCWERFKQRCNESRTI